MKHTTYTCNFCLHPITNTKNMYNYRGEEYQWLFSYENEIHLHHSCIKLWNEAKKLDCKAASDAYETCRVNLAPKSQPIEVEIDEYASW